MASNSPLATSPVIDPRNEQQLTQEAKLYAFQVSSGLLNSNNIGDPLDVFIRTQAYAGAELLFYASQLPLAFALKFLEATGAVRSLGNKARATVTFQLVAIRPNPFFIPAGFEVTGSTSEGTFSYYTVEDLTIPQNTLQGQVVVEARENGESYNLPAGQISAYTQPIAFLQSVINLERAAGGADAESIESAVSRGITALRRRNPISVGDFEEEAQLVMGQGSRCKAIGLLGIDKITYERGAVHLFLLASDGVPANKALLTQVRSSIEPRIQAGTRLHISPMNVIEVRCEIIAKINSDAIPSEVADNLWIGFRQQLNPIDFEVGSSVYIDEISHQLRFAGGVEYIEELYLNRDSLPIAMPNLFTLPVAMGILCRLVDESGVIHLEMRGDLNYDTD